MPKFRKKPVVIEAIQFVTPMSVELCDFVDGHISSISSLEDGSAEMELKTLKGVITASEGDWIIQGVQGELYPCKPDIFDLTYEEVSYEQVHPKNCTPVNHYDSDINEVMNVPDMLIDPVSERRFLIQKWEPCCSVENPLTANIDVIIYRYGKGPNVKS